MPPTPSPRSSRSPSAETERDSPRPPPGAEDPEAAARAARIATIPHILHRSHLLWRSVPVRCQVDLIAAVKPCALRILACSHALDDAGVDDAVVELLLLLPALLQQDRPGVRGERELRHRAAQYIAGRPIPEAKRAEFNERTPDELERALVLRSVKLARRGHLQKAVTVLSNQPLRDPTEPGVLQDLHEMHRTRFVDPLPPLPPGIVVPILSSDQVLKAAQRAANGAAPGPSGIDAEVFRDLMKDAQILQALTEVVNRSVSGRLGDKVRELLLPRSLLPTLKPDGGTRPISVGDSLYKIASIALLSCVPSTELRSIFGDCQYAYGVAGGSEKAVHTIRTHLAKVQDSIAVAIDIESAYPSRDRKTIQQSLLSDPRTAFMAPLFHWAHDRPSKLLVYHKGQLLDVVSQGDGVCQGDPTGTFNFCKSISHHLTAAQESADVKITSVADDITITGKPREVFKAFDKLKTDLEAEGIIIKLRKSFCLWPRLSAVPASVSAGARKRGLELKHKAAKILGAFIGDDLDAHRLFVKERLEQATKILDRLRHPVMPIQLAQLLLRACVLPRANYLLRVSPPAATNAATADFDRRIIAFAIDKLNLPADCPGQARQQLELPLVHGGFGLRPLRRSAAAAYLSSFLQLRDSTGAVDLPPGESDLLDDLQDCIDWIHHHYPETATDLHLPHDAKQVFGILPDQKLQSLLVRHMEKSEISTFRTTFSDDRTLARMTSLATPEATLWLTSKPTSPALSFSDPVFSVLVRIFLGLPIGDDIVARCKCNASLTADDTVDHWHTCPFAYQARVQRHNGLVHTLRSSIQTAGAPSALEQLFAPGVSGKRADIVTALNGYTARPLRIAIDMSVVTSTAKSYREAEDATETRESEKLSKYKEFKGEYEIVPCILDNHGRMGKRLQLFLSRVASQATDVFTSGHPHVDPAKIQAQFLHSYRRHLLHSLMFGTAHMLMNGVLNCQLAFSVGRLVIGQPCRRLGRVAVSVPVP